MSQSKTSGPGAASAADADRRVTALALSDDGTRLYASVPEDATIVV